MSKFPLQAIGLLVVLSACSASTQKPAVDAVMADDELRGESLEATLRVTDEHPEYVDDLFARTLRHPRTLDRFLQNTAKGLEREDLSRMAARRLSENPAGLKQTMVATLDAVSDKPASQAAIAEAMAARPQVAAMSVVQRDEALRSMLRALVAECLKNKQARTAFLAALQENSEPMAQILATNPETMGKLMAALTKVGVATGKEEVKAAVKKLGSND